MQKTIERLAVLATLLLLACHPATASACELGDPGTDLSVILDRCDEEIAANQLAGSDLADALHVKAMAHFYFAHFDEAAALLGTAHTLKPRDPSILADLASSHSGRIDHRAVDRVLAKAFELDADFAPTWRAAGMVKLIRCHCADAVPPLTRALELLPEDPHTLRMLAQTLFLSGDRDQSFLVFDRLLAQGEDKLSKIWTAGADPATRDFVAETHSMLAAYQRMAGRVDAAIANHEIALGRHPRHMTYILRYADTLSRLDRDSTGKALALLQKAWTDDLHHWRIAGELGFISGLLGNRHDATAWLLEAEKLGPIPFDFHWKRAKTRALTGDQVGALADLEAGFAMSPTEMNRAIYYMTETGYLMEMPGVPSETLWANAVSACLLDRDC
ncbi:tetratricopeptide repeat protein [Chthonobacter albigriseus]|uniref:tetratricopeptide repeat protein n=1 Tax=Chthonobacter albigriseus TaxID=1683161 RepID=UPI0015EF1822|nr:hypothetical protein [Chthonobacter albigriseus]